MTFEKLGLSQTVLKAVAEQGYEQPTPVQAAVIPKVFAHKDLVGCAQTGTGKTASFTLPMIDILSKGRSRARMPRSLVLSPTRELAAQIAKDFETYGKYAKLEMALLIGGVSYDEQEKKLMRGVDVLIATPGRLLDHFENGKILLNDIRIFVIDEADRMLDMGFIPDIEKIAGILPFTRQTLLFSATMPPPIKKLAGKFLTAPEMIEIAPPATTAENVAQFLVKAPPDSTKKRKLLCDFVRREKVKNAIIFCNRKKDIDSVVRALDKDGYAVAPLHGDLNQHERTRTLKAFKEEEFKLLVASDVAARGLDVENLSHVFNFDVPQNADDYVHRIGRTGRAGQKGRAFTFVTKKEQKYIDDINKNTNEDLRYFEEGAAPDNQDKKTASEKDKGQSTQKSGEKSKKGKKPEQKSQKPHKPVTGQKDDNTSDKASAPAGNGNIVGFGDATPAFLMQEAGQVPEDDAPAKPKRRRASGKG